MIDHRFKSMIFMIIRRIVLYTLSRILTPTRTDNNVTLFVVSAVVNSRFKRNLLNTSFLEKLI